MTFNPMPFLSPSSLLKESGANMGSVPVTCVLWAVAHPLVAQHVGGKPPCGRALERVFRVLPLGGHTWGRNNKTFVAVRVPREANSDAGHFGEPYWGATSQRRPALTSARRPHLGCRLLQTWPCRRESTETSSQRKEAVSVTAPFLSCSLSLLFWMEVGVPGLCL